jgi:DNA-binding NarL/FixJ family response regulator
VRKFLVVEDRPAFARAVSRLLSKYGTVVRVGTVQEASAAIAAHPYFSALIVDLHLPDGDGLVVLRIFREKFADRPALVLTGYPDPQNINAAYDLKADFVAKPFSAARVHHFIRSNVLSRQRRSPVSSSAVLTDREREVVQRALQGFDDKEIARDLEIAPSTVRGLMARASGKLGVFSRDELLELAKDFGLEVGAV